MEEKINYGPFFGFALIAIAAVIVFNQCAENTKAVSELSAAVKPTPIPFTEADYEKLLKEFQNIEKTLSCSTDKFQQARFCQIKGSRTTSIKPYLVWSPGAKDKIPVCGAKLEVLYTGERWIFFNKVIVLADGTPFKYVLKDSPKRDVSYGTIYETYDVPVKDAEIELLKVISSSKVAEVRLDGEKIWEFKISNAQKTAIKNVLRAAEICEIAMSTPIQRTQ